MKIIILMLYVVATIYYGSMSFKQIRNLYFGVIIDRDGAPKMVDTNEHEKR